MVVVCFDPEFVYIKTQKTAGTSTEMVLEKFCGPPGRKITERSRGYVSKYGIIGRRLNVAAAGPADQKPSWRPHISASEVRRLVMPDFWERAEIIANIRNPFARNFSWFNWTRKMNKRPDFATFEEHRDAFRAWLPTAKDVGERKRLFVDGAPSPTKIIRFEHLEEDLAEVCNELGLSDPPSLPETKMSSRPDDAPTLKDYYDQRGIEIIQRNCEWLFEAGNYPETPPDR